MDGFHYRQEVYRKLIHLSSLWMPAAIYLLPRPWALALFSALAGVTLAYEVVRRRQHGLARLLDRLLGAALRPDEKGARFKPSGAIYVLAGAFLAALLFPPLIAATALAMMLTGDVAAALVGRKWGRVRILGKTLEGALAFFVTAWLTAAAIAMLAPTNEGYLCTAAAAAAAAAGVELVSKKLGLDDNLTVPLAAGAAMAFLL